MNPFIKTTTLFLIFTSLLCSCSPTLNYLGNSYAPTQNIEIYFDEHDIKREYTVMGIVKNEGSGFEFDDTESIQEAMLKKAKSVGADAILYLGLYKEIERSRETNTNYNKGSKRETTSSTTSKIYEAKFLKYQK